MKKSLLALAVAILVLSFGANAAAPDPVLEQIFAAPEVAVAATDGAATGEVVSVELVFDPGHPGRVQGAITHMASGCSATVSCLHGGSVSCSSPTGTCTISHAQCGWVQCGSNPPVRCAGSCAQDWHCFSFCGGDEGAICAWDKCCECS